MTKTYKKFETTVGGRKVTVETGKYCELSNGSCIVTCGETVVMANATMAPQARDGVDFFPLGIDFEEKMYAVGKIPGGFKKREMRPTDKAILTSRLIDRPLRPLFPKGFYNDVNIVVTALSVEPGVAPETFGMLASSIALSISDIPFQGPTGSVVVGMVDGKFVINPDDKQCAKSKLHLVLSGTDEAILMVEAGAQFISEKDMLKAIEFGHEEIKKQVKFINDIVKEIGKAKIVPTLHLPTAEAEKKVVAFAEKLYVEALSEKDRQKRQAKEDAVEVTVMEHFAPADDKAKREIVDVLYNLKKKLVREKIVNKGERPDGRKTDEIRPIWCEAGVLPRVHGSAVFTRGQTQVLTTCTLGTMRDAQMLDGLDDEESKRYMHHYNMPPYSTGESKMLKTAGRREIGHGALAERSLEPVLPTEAEFPYAIRTVSEVLSSNGSSSMASVCGSTMALCQAGVPIKANVAGIAMGLIKDGKKVAVLTDIQGLEDFLGDMDFKVAGTREGITAIQMDIKIKGIDDKILKEALEDARIGRLKILDIMEKTIKVPNKEVSKYAPKIITFNIKADKIKDVIGSGGKVINKIIEETGVKIDIEDDGRVFVACQDPEKAEKAKQIILGICFEPEIGKEYTGKVARIMPFGAFVEFSGTEGMVHISKLSKTRVEKVEDVVKIGDTVQVKVIKIDEKGRVDLMRLEK